MPDRASPTVSSYLVEWYRPGLTRELLRQTAHEIGRSAGELSAEGAVVDLLLTLFVPDDEVAFCLFAANSRASVTRVCRRAQLPVHRIADALAAPAHLDQFMVGDCHVSGGDNGSPNP